MTTFHYAFKVTDLSSTRRFYGDILGCTEGRSTETWIDFDFFGHQLSAHLSADIPALDYCGTVDGIAVPIPHFGCLLTPAQFRTVQARLEKANVKFIIPPQTRYRGEKGEQLTMFITDFSHNPIEFKAFKNAGEVF